MIYIDCIITEGGIIEAMMGEDLTIYVDIIESGPQGPIGPKGDSAYEHWLSLGNVGTINDFLLTLKGDKGDPGVGLQYEWVGSRLGIKTEAESDFEYVDLAAASGDIAYTHHQTSASREWLVCHNLGKYPSVTVVDSAGSVVVGDIAYLNTEELIIRFTSEFSGRAFLN